MLAGRFASRPSLERQSTNFRKRKKTQPWRLRKSMLHDRLKELLVFEISKEGHREYRNMTLRGLYNYVLEAIATRPPDLQVRSSIEVVSQIAEGDPFQNPMGHHQYHRGARRATVHDNKGKLNSFLGNQTQFRDQFKKRNSVENFSIEESVKEESDEDVDEADVCADDMEDASQSSASISLPPLPTARKQRQGRVSFAGAMDASQQIHMAMAGPSSRRFSTASTVNNQVTYRERLGGYLHPRDMRRLVTPFSASNEPELIVRRHVVLLNFDPLRAIVLRDRLLVLVPDGADSILEELSKRIRGGLAEIENAVFGTDSTHHSFHNQSSSGSKKTNPLQRKLTASGKKMKEPTASPGAGLMNRLNLDTERATGFRENLMTRGPGPEIDFAEDDNTVIGEDDDEFRELNDREWIDLPFELQSVDAVLHTVCMMLNEDANELQEYAYETIEQLLLTHNASSVSGENGHDALRFIKNEISQMQGRVQGFIRAMNIVLDDDKDMALMNLTRLITHPDRFIQPVSQDILHEESDEPELILEAYMQQALSNTNALDLLKDELSNTEELLNMKLDAVRNRLLYVNTVVSLLSLTVGIGSFVGAIFGMNVTNPLETDDDAFRKLVLGTCVGMVGILGIMSYVFYRAGHLPRLQP